MTGILHITEAQNFCTQFQIASPTDHVALNAANTRSQTKATAIRFTIVRESKSQVPDQSNVQFAFTFINPSKNTYSSVLHSFFASCSGVYTGVIIILAHISFCLSQFFQVVLLNPDINVCINIIDILSAKTIITGEKINLIIFPRSAFFAISHSHHS